MSLHLTFKLVTRPTVVNLKAKYVAWSCHGYVTNFYSVAATRHLVSNPVFFYAVPTIHMKNIMHMYTSCTLFTQHFRLLSMPFCTAAIPSDVIKIWHSRSLRFILLLFTVFTILPSLDWSNWSRILFLRELKRPRSNNFDVGAQKSSIALVDIKLKLDHRKVQLPRTWSPKNPYFDTTVWHKIENSRVRFLSLRRHYCDVKLFRCPSLSTKLKFLFS